MRRTAAAALAVMSLWPLAAPARAIPIKPILKQTLGSRHYASTYGAVEIGDQWRFKPSVSSYHSDDATGTYKTYGFKVAYDTGAWGVAILGGLSPRVNGYANHFVGGEVSRNFDFEKKAGRAPTVSHVDLTGAVTQTQHSDEFSGTLNKQGRLVLVRSTTSTLDIGQSDFEGIVGVELLKTRLELDVTKSLYNKDVSRIGARSAQVAFLSGLSGTIQGFPDLNVNTRVDVQRWDDLAPWVSYTYTEYKVQQRPSAAYAVGLDLTPTDPLFISMSYQLLSQSGQSDRNYWSLQASYRFE